MSVCYRNSAKWKYPHQAVRVGEHFFLVARQSDVTPASSVYSALPPCLPDKLSIIFVSGYTLETIAPADIPAKLKLLFQGRFRFPKNIL
jgi:hypothetical protein